MTEPYVKTIIIALIPIGLLLDILAYRWRKFANVIAYYEMLSMLVQGFVPFNYGNFDILVVAQQHFLSYWITVTWPGQGAIGYTVTEIVFFYVVIPLMYNIEGGTWTMGRQLAVLQMVVISFIFLSTFSMVITYIARIQGKMNFVIIENIHLLNRMHEGLVVVEQEDLDLKFATIPAVSLLKQ